MTLEACSTPACPRPAGHITNYPCGGQLHVPGSPCQYCGKATPFDGNACPDCWTPITNLADVKALFADIGLSLGMPHKPDKEQL